MSSVLLVGEEKTGIDRKRLPTLDKLISQVKVFLLN
jgi:hypothetical protein